jgi:hypothetical protein
MLEYDMQKGEIYGTASITVEGYKA